MTAIFLKILNMSLTAGYCIGAVLVLRFLLRRQAKIFSYLLWAVVLFRLLCPISLTSSFSLLRMDTAILSEAVFSDGQQEVWQGKGYFSDETNGSAAKPMVSAGVFPAQETGMGTKALAVGAWVWMTGVCVLLGYSVWTAVRLRRFLSGARPAKEGADGMAGRCVFELEGMATPFVFGILRPRIYLPSYLSAEEGQYVLAHERAHIARRDYLVKLIGWGAVCLHWFNPLVWLSFRLMESDMEMSCDERVLGQLGEDVKQAYSRALLSLSCEKSGFHASPVAFGEGGIKNRIRNILSWKKSGIVTAAVLGVLLCALAAGLMLNPGAPEKQQEKEAEEALRHDFVSVYANAYCDRYGNQLVGMYADEETAYESLPLLEKEGDVYTFGFSSPWPNEFRFALHEGETKEEGSAEIWYYAWTSDPHVVVWKEEIQFARQGAGGEGDYRVTGSVLHDLNNISTKAEFDEAYLIGGTYQFTDYEERGFLDGIQAQTEYDRENGGEDRNAVYRDPVTAAAWMLNLTGGRGEAVSDDAEDRVTVRYTFADESSVEIPMRVADIFVTEAEAEPAQEDAEHYQVWLLDWSA